MRTRYVAALALVFALLVWYRPAHAVSPACSQIPNLVCATADDTLTGTYTIVDANPLVFDVTPGGSTTTWSVTDPTGARTIFVPDADTALAQAQSCGAGTHISAFSAATGAFTCTADTGGTPTWDAIADPTTNQTLNMAAYYTQMIWSSATSTTDLFILRDGVSNTGTGYILSVNTNTSSSAKPVRITAGGTVNGVDMSTSGVLAKIGSGSIQADDVVCTTCVGTTDIANNAVDATKLGIGVAQGDVLVYGVTDWAALTLGADNTVLQSNGTTAVWAGIDAAMLGAGDLANVLVWNETPSGTWPNFTLANTPRTADTLQVVVNGLVYTRKTSACASEVGQYTVSGTSLVMCNGEVTDPGTTRVLYEM